LASATEVAQLKRDISQVRTVWPPRVHRKPRQSCWQTKVEARRSNVQFI
jgi:hypothetical protein